MRERVEIGDGLLDVTIGTVRVTVDPVAWVEWHETYTAPEGAGPWAMQRAALVRLREEADKEGAEVDLNLTQIDAFLHEILLWFGRLKKKQREALGWPALTGSAPSD